MDSISVPNKKFMMNFSPGTEVVQFLEGKALQPLPPVRITLEGKIDAPLSFYKARKNTLDIKKCHVVVTQNGIKLIFNEDDPFTNGYIHGKLTLAGECNQFQINNPTMLYDSKDLARLIKKNEFLFASKEEWKTVYNALMRFESNVQINLRDHKETNGDIDKAYKVTVQNNMPAGFTLNTKVLAQTRHKYYVDMGGEFVGQNVKFYLDSAELALMISTQTEKYLEEFVKEFVKDGIAVIHT